MDSKTKDEMDRRYPNAFGKSTRDGSDRLPPESDSPMGGERNGWEAYCSFVDGGLVDPHHAEFTQICVDVYKRLRRESDEKIGRTDEDVLRFAVARWNDRHGRQKGAGLDELNQEEDDD